MNPPARAASVLRDANAEGRRILARVGRDFNNEKSPTAMAGLCVVGRHLSMSGRLESSARCVATGHFTIPARFPRRVA
jgi:hypothetical protein